jgi:hypothetical protein
MRNPRIPILCSVLLFGLAGRAHAIELTGFLSRGSPGVDWGTGYGGTFTTGWFHVVALEAEYAHQPGANPGVSIDSFTGDALLAPPIGFVTPYGGVGVGLYHQSTLSDSDTGTLRALILGAKVKVVGLIVLKVEYRRMDLSSSALVPFHHRVSAGAGISF